MTPIDVHELAERDARDAPPHDQPDHLVDDARFGRLCIRLRDRSGDRIRRLGLARCPPTGQNGVRPLFLRNPGVGLLRASALDLCSRIREQQLGLGLRALDDLLRFDTRFVLVAADDAPRFHPARDANRNGDRVELRDFVSLLR